MIKEKLIRARKDKKFSQLDIAEHLNISQTQYLRKEKGEIEIKDDEWERIAKLLDIEVDEIKEEDSSRINQFFDVSGEYKNSYIGSNNNYCNIPEFLLESQREYMEILKQEIQQLKEKVSQLENQNK
ncbi:helix-turn-helix transcriptional regulator [Chryseobacterium limigenitum]|uniref:Helix-turn-helix n=1 Tax=Chryseobacterium limigenitum TaxID=1612149 RepID=A0A1K2IV01_9FLAO|nr:helix-turn-helix transcriptional regulator [Chryseobacterium limigenitum]SFZ96257.1 Helix-turn-helix [Chryseobacterium limigenitum]